MNAPTRITISSLQPRTFDEVKQFAEIVARTNLVPRAYQGNPAGIVAAVIWGDSIGLPPMASLQSIAPGPRPFVWGDGLVAICRVKHDWESMEEKIVLGVGEDDTTAFCTCKRKGQPPVTRSFSLKDARRAGLLSKDTWKSYPERMLSARARGFAIRDQWQDAIMGLITEAEANDYPVSEEEVKHLPVITDLKDLPESESSLPSTPLTPQYDPEVEEWLRELAVQTDLTLKDKFLEIQKKIRDRKDAGGLAAAVSIKNILKNGHHLVSENDLLDWVYENRPEEEGLLHVNPLVYGTVVLYSLEEIQKTLPDFKLSETS